MAQPRRNEDDWAGDPRKWLLDQDLLQRKRLTVAGQYTLGIERRSLQRNVHSQTHSNGDKTHCPRTVLKFKI